MFLRFQERIALPVSTLYGYFRTPEDWVRLYGSFGRVEVLDDGWRAVKLAGFPFPLVAKITEDRPSQLVRWRFRGFWQGEGEVRFDPQGDTRCWWRASSTFVRADSRSSRPSSSGCSSSAAFGPSGAPASGGSPARPRGPTQRRQPKWRYRWLSRLPDRTSPIC